MLDPSEFQSRDTVKPLETAGNLGIIVPPLVRPRKDGRFEIVAGHRRVESARSRGLKTIECEVKQVDDKKAAMLHYGENADRADLSPVEKGRFFERFLKKFRLSEREAEKELGVSHSLINQSVGLARISEEVVKRLTKEEAASMGDVLTAVKYQAVGALPHPQKISVLTEAVKHRLSDRDTKKVADYVQMGGDIDAALALVKSLGEGKRKVQFDAREVKPAKTVCPQCHANILVEHLPNGKHRILESSPSKPPQA